MVLAAGEGSRFAGPVHKLRAEFRGRPLVQWATDAALGATLARDSALEATVAGDAAPESTVVRDSAPEATDARDVVVEATPGTSEAPAPALAAVYVVLGAEDLSDLLPPEVTIVQNHEWRRGQAWSLQAGVRIAEMDGHAAVVVGVADQPLVGAEAWRRVAKAPGSIVTAVYGSRRRPPVKLDASVWPLLPLGGDEGARQLMRRHPEMVREVSCPGDPTDIDTLEDLHRRSR